MTSLSSLKKRAEALEKRRVHKRAIHVISEEYSMQLLSTPPDPPRVYIPSRTGRQFHEDDTFIRLVMGPYNSGKSTMCVQEIVRRACQMPKWYKGKRRSRWIIIRNTSAELKSTTLATWLNWCEGMGEYQKNEKPFLRYLHTFNDKDGEVDLELVFLALDRPDDIKKIKSFEATGAYVNEISEMPKAILDHLVGRVLRRYPPVDFCDEPYWCGIIADTNPPDEDHWIFKDFEEKQSESYKIFHQPEGLLQNDDGSWRPNTDCDNYSHIDKNFYVTLAENKDDEFIKVYCLGRYGIVGNNKRVYPEYNDDLHSSFNVKPIQGHPIHLGWDSGLTPTCVVVQFTPRGQLLVLKEYCGEDMGIRTFAQSVVLPALKTDFPYNKYDYSVADPAGKNRSEIFEELSFIGELNSLGITTEAASTNKPDTRISAVKFFLGRMIDGKPAFMLSREGCPTLRKGFIKNYYYKRLLVAGEERYRDVPDKNMASHPHDALQYICLRLAPIKTDEEKKESNTKDFFNPVSRVFTNF